MSVKKNKIWFSISFAILMLIGYANQANAQCEILTPGVQTDRTEWMGVVNDIIADGGDAIYENFEGQAGGVNGTSISYPWSQVDISSVSSSGMGTSNWSGTYNGQNPMSGALQAVQVVDGVTTIVFTFDPPVTGVGINIGDIHDGGGGGTSTLDVSFGVTPVWQSEAQWPGGVQAATNILTGEQIDMGNNENSFFGYYDPINAVTSLTIVHDDDVNGSSGDNFAFDDLTFFDCVGGCRAVVDQHVTCSGDADGAATVTVSGSSGPYDVDWSTLVSVTGLNDGQTHQQTGLSGGAYTVTVTDSGNEETTCEVIIEEPDPIVLSEIHVDETLCGMGNGTIDLTWEGGGVFPDVITQEAFTGAGGPITATKNASTDFPLTVSGITPSSVDENTIAQVCVDLVTVPKDKVEKHRFVLVNPCGGTLDLKSKANPGGTNFADVCFEPGAAANITTAASPYTGTWLPQGGDLDEVGGPLTGCDPNGDWIFRIVNGENNAGEVRDWDITLVNVVPGVPSDYEWSSDVGGFGNPTTEDLSGLEAGNYTVTVTDERDCTATQEVEIECPNDRACSILVSSDFNGEDISCSGLSDGEAIVTVTGSNDAFSVLWSGGTNTMGAGLADGGTHIGTGLSAGNYTVTVTDNGGETASCEVVLEEPTQVVATITGNNEPQCNGGSDGDVTVEGTFGTPGYTYLWDGNASAQTTAQATGLDAGTFTVIVLDVNLCTATTSVTIGEPTQLVVIPDVTHISCNAGNDGAISLAVSEATPTYTYIWSTLETTKDIQDLDAANAPYNVTVTDANGCSVIETGTPTEPAAIDYATDYSPSTCSQQDGEAFIVNGNAGISGGTSPYTYEWTDASLNTNTNAVFAGTYTVTVTDDANCSVSVVQVVQDAGAPTASILAQTIEVDCFEDCDGFITVQFADGAAGYTVAWPSGASTLEAVAGDVTENNLCAGDYIVTITDANDCVVEVPATITEPDVLTSLITNSNDPQCFNGVDGDATVAALGGTPIYSYLWSSNTTDQTNTQAATLGAGSYGVTVTDSKGCITSTQVTLQQPTEVVSDIEGIDVTCFGLSNGSVDLNPSGGTGVLSFVWSPNSETSEDLTGVIAGTYDVEISDGNGCTATNTYTVNEPDVVTAVATTVRHSTCDEDCFDGEVTSAGTGGDLNYRYLWDDPDAFTTVGVDGVEEGTYCVTITDGNDCAASNCTIVLGEPGMVWVEEITHILC
ncbi:MAG: SprB repeat-containing protein [Flavobacteriales bacterium]|nr:SprB repeat-containing protein [Flavobacteriales bacterium]